MHAQRRPATWDCMCLENAKGWLDTQFVRISENSVITWMNQLSKAFNLSVKKLKPLSVSGLTWFGQMPIPSLSLKQCSSSQHFKSAIYLKKPHQKFLEQQNPQRKPPSTTKLLPLACTVGTSKTSSLDIKKHQIFHSPEVCDVSSCSNPNMNEQRRGKHPPSWWRMNAAF